MDSQDVNLEAANIKVKPGEATEEVDRKHNSRWGLFGLGSGGLEDQRRDLHPAVNG